MVGPNGCTVSLPATPLLLSPYLLPCCATAPVALLLRDLCCLAVALTVLLDQTTVPVLLLPCLLRDCPTTAVAVPLFLAAFLNFRCIGCGTYHRRRRRSGERGRTYCPKGTERSCDISGHTAGRTWTPGTGSDKT